MHSLTVIIVLLLLMALAYRVGLTRSRHLASGARQRLHSRPVYHGTLLAIWCAIPALIVLVLWAVFGDELSRFYILAQLPADVAKQPADQLDLVVERIRQIASGFGVADTEAPYESEIAAGLRTFGTVAWLSVVALAAVAGLVATRLAWSRISPELRARNEVERVVGALLAFCSGVAILTTIGIVASLLGEAIRFFTFVSPIDFFFGTVWNPRFSTVGAGGQGDFGLLPLLWGTVLVSLIAMLVAGPIGLMAAIYMAEYAPRRVRMTAKPIVEILAGIPTIVYGFFALTIVGPFLADIGASIGLDIRATSAFTAGVVMGIMIIPFISSLSDDIITQVPRAMRDGSLGLGSTHSETIKRVVLPAALPGLVGAFLLAISRAVGETMIVVLAAGNRPVLNANPFEAVSTVTVTIVNQLTGDADFASPQSLVAFALGLTLFAMTLALNVVALYIVRKYREQYE